MIKRLLDGWGPTRRLKLLAFQARQYARHRQEGERILRAGYEELHGRPLDADVPVRFTEKLYAWQIRLHRNGDRRFAPFADKLASRDFVRERAGAEFLPDLYWHGEDPEAIPFERLPSRYVIKPNHRSGGVFLAPEGLDREAAVAELTELMAESYYWCGREYQYLGIPRRVMVEERIDDGTGGPPLDYSAWCFHGRPRLVQVRKYHRVVNQFYDLDWNRLDLKTRPEVPDVELPRPPRLEAMLDVAGRLARDFDFVRVDFYLPPGRVLFSEMTFSPSGGHARFQPPGWDEELGRMWRWGGRKADAG